MLKSGLLILLLMQCNRNLVSATEACVHLANVV